MEFRRKLLLAVMCVVLLCSFGPSCTEAQSVSILEKIKSLIEENNRMMKSEAQRLQALERDVFVMRKEQMTHDNKTQTAISDVKYSMVENVERDIKETHCQRAIVKLSCPAKTCIHIKQARYGRFSTTDCPYPPFPMTLCVGDDVIPTRHLRATCNERQTCTFTANNPIFGNPCPGIGKILELHYQCIPY